MQAESDNRRDLELLARLADGRPDALGMLYERHAASLFRHAMALTRARLDAEDLVHTVFVKLAAAGPELLGVRKPAGYLHRMVHTTWLDGRRRDVTGAKVVEQASRAELTWTAGRGGASEDAIDVSRALEALPPLEREVIVLHIMDGFSFREIGRLTGVSLFTAAGRYRTGIGRMRRAIGDVKAGAGHGREQSPTTNT